MLFLTVKNSVLTIHSPGCCYFSMPLEGLKSGTVYDASRGSQFRRVWVSGSDLHFAEQFGHDVAWAHYVAIFQLPEGDCDITYPVKEVNLHDYLIQGNGIPAASAEIPESNC